MCKNRILSFHFNLISSGQNMFIINEDDDEYRQSVKITRCVGTEEPCGNGDYDFQTSYDNKCSQVTHTKKTGSIKNLLIYFCGCDPSKKKKFLPWVVFTCISFLLASRRVGHCTALVECPYRGHQERNLVIQTKMCFWNQCKCVTPSQGSLQLWLIGSSLVHWWNLL